VLNEAGAIVWEGKVESEPAAIVRMLKRRAPKAVKVSLETGPTSTWLWHELKQRGIPVVCIDARHAQAALSLQQLLACRALLVKQRCEIENQIRGLLKNFGLRAAKGKGRAFQQSVEALAGGHDFLRQVVAPLITAWLALRQQTVVLTRAVNQRTNQSPTCRRLMTMPGVGAMTSLAYMSTIDDPARFRSSSSVGAYLGLTPRRYASGESERMGRISRCGDALTRSYLYEAANIMLSRTRGTSALRSWGLKLAKKIGFKKARVALARKMAVVLHRMWMDGTDFRATSAAA
jgi:transposase